MGVTWHTQRTINPAIGDTYFDTASSVAYIWEGSKWAALSGPFSEPEPKIYAPTNEQLEKYPSLKSAWEEYMVVRKLLGT